MAEQNAEPTSGSSDAASQSSLSDLEAIAEASRQVAALAQAAADCAEAVSAVEGQQSPGPWDPLVEYLQVLGEVLSLFTDGLWTPVLDNSTQDTSWQYRGLGPSGEVLPGSTLAGKLELTKSLADKVSGEQHEVQLGLKRLGYTEASDEDETTSDPDEQNNDVDASRGDPVPRDSVVSVSATLLGSDLIGIEQVQKWRPGLSQDDVVRRALALQHFLEDQLRTRGTKLVLHGPGTKRQEVKIPDRPRSAVR